MFLVIGLGNTGKEYNNTRHNIGFRILDILSDHCRLDFQKKTKFNALIASSDSAKPYILCKPETYMNLSGEAVCAVASYYKITLDKIIVFHDDIDLSLGKIKCKIGGGAGGHNGLRSIDRLVGSNYHRIRIGVGRPKEAGYAVSDFVLGKFSSDEELVMSKTMDLIVKNFDLLINEDIEGFKKVISS